MRPAHRLKTQLQPEIGAQIELVGHQVPVPHLSAGSGQPKALLAAPQTGFALAQGLLALDQVGHIQCNPLDVSRAAIGGFDAAGAIPKMAPLAACIAKAVFDLVVNAVLEGLCQGPHSAVAVFGVQGLAPRLGIGHPFIDRITQHPDVRADVERGVRGVHTGAVHHCRHLLGHLPELALASQQKTFEELALGDVVAEDGEPLRRGKHTHFDPLVPRRVESLEHLDLLGPQGFRVGVVKRAAMLEVVLVPDVPTDQLFFALALQQAQGWRVQVGETQVLVQRDDRVTDPMHHMVEQLHRRVRFASCALGLPLERQLLRHLVDDHQACRPAFPLDIAGGDVNIDQAAVFQCMLPAAGQAQAVRAQGIVVDLRRRQALALRCAPDVHDGELEERFPGIAIPRNGCGIHREHALAGLVKHPHGLGVGVKQQSVLGLPHNFGITPG